MLNDRFWTKVRVAGPDECWVWTANKNNKGYGMFRPGGLESKRLAHRLSYADANGPIPDGMVIMHKCDNPPCVNPKHLSAGTMKQNSVDAVTKGRAGNMKVSDAAFIGIVKGYVAGQSYAELASRFGVSTKSIPDYISGNSRPWLYGKHGCPTIEQVMGARNTKPGALINEDTVLSIRKRLKGGELGKDLAIEYGIHKATISDIKLRKIWKDV